MNVLYSNVQKFETALRKRTGSNFERRGQKMALKLFHEMALRVPAYIHFLQANHIDPKKIQSIKDFRTIPCTTKENYVKKYPLEMLCWDGEFHQKQWTICSTSGSSGEPFYFPHEKEQDWQYAKLAELYLRTNFQIHKKSTLYIDGFMMGAWIGGVFTYEAIRLLAEKGNYKLSIITPGADKKGIINSVKTLGPKFDQVIIGSYGPFLKDVLDEGLQQGLKWKKYNLGFVFSAEGFSEEMRDYVLQVAGAKNKYTSSLNHYGTVDLGTMSYETPVSILIRKKAIQNRQLYTSLFGETTKLPTLTQYIPELFYFEEEHNTVICTSRSGLPLVRYNLNDHGGVCTFEAMQQYFQNEKQNITMLSKKAQIQSTVWKLPFVWVFERNDFMVKFYLCDIYPETIRKALFQKSLIKKITGKFLMKIGFDKDLNQFLEINVELKPNAVSTREFKQKVTKIITDELLKTNTGYQNVYSRIHERAIPKIIFWKYEHARYFKPGGKQKWVKK